MKIKSGSYYWASFLVQLLIYARNAYLNVFNFQIFRVFLSAQTSAFDIDAASKFIEDSEKELLETEKILKEFRDRGDLGPTYEFLRVNYLKSKKNLETAKDAHSRLIEGHWNFKGTHDGELFGIPATNNKVDLSGTTLVWMKDGKVIKEQDFFDNHSFLTQLGLL